jgi:solute carrier family 35 protein E1
MIATLLNLIVWYVFAAACTIFTRDLDAAGFGSLSISLAQFLVGAVLSAMTIMCGKNRDFFIGNWSTRLKGVICCYSFGHILTNYSFLVMQPSFSHTVKASEPVFTVLLARILARPNPNSLQLMSLCPIVLGVMIASFSEFAFPWTGLLASLSSNLFFSARNVRADSPPLPITTSIHCDTTSSQ